VSDAMRERLIAKVIEVGVLDNFGSPGTTPSRESAEEIVDAILHEMREPDDHMVASMIADLGEEDTPDRRKAYRDIVLVAVDHVTGDGIIIPPVGVK
jgi:hypothetical protein